MKRILKLLLLLVLIVITGCESGSLCSTGPVAFTFEFVDKDSGENLFANGTLDAKKSITITDLNENKTIQTTYMTADNSNRLSLVVGVISGVYKYNVKIEDKSLFEITAVTQRVKGKECSNTVLKSVEIKNVEYKQDNETGIYKIFINTKS
ncbi:MULTISPECIES: hypothetical protein [Flavobacterium]|uniref:hypothetical protein n=1 Tax=Flavobacterium TaxID=237 RepID=UPI00118211F3|nr:MULTISPECIES: hypothetical protein [Flavobacterium]MCR4030063.1 hypothetical protein [Flavobacterium panacis]